MKLLMVGPFPPPHGGVSIHVARAAEELRSAGIPCRVLNTVRCAPPSGQYIGVRSRFGIAAEVARHALAGWTIHVHTNGHNRRGWLLALLCGVAAEPAPGSVLTLHSGLTPRYLDSGGPAARRVAASACGVYGRVVCVNPSIKAAVGRLGIASGSLAVIPAFLGSARAGSAVPAPVVTWMRSRDPVLCAVLSFRPEYGFELLLEAVARLRRSSPRLGLLVIGDSEHRNEAVRVAEASGQGTAVLLVGDVSHPECLALMARSDVFVRATLADGDAISVREAIALGTPVVASDAAGRPPGVSLFRAGDPAALTATLKAVLARPSVGSPMKPEQEQTSRIDRLLEIYDQAAG